MWFFYALGASVLWGVCYAAFGRAMHYGFPPVLAKGAESLFALCTVGLFCALKYRGQIPGEVARLGPGGWWLLLAVASSAVGNLLIFLSIGSSNATLASLVEISYPLFVALFAWLFFGEKQIDGPLLLGMGLIAAGTALIYLKR